MSIRINQRALRVELALKGWTQLDLAAHSEISGPTANAAATGKAVSPKTFKKIAQALGLTAEDSRGLIEGLPADFKALAS